MAGFNNTWDYLPWEIEALQQELMGTTNPVMPPDQDQDANPPLYDPNQQQQEHVEFEPTNTMQGEEGCSANPHESTVSGSRKRTSDVWKSFDVVMINGEERASCKKCKKVLTCKSSGGTGHLTRHIKSHQTQIDRAQATLNLSSSSFEVFNYSTEVLRKELAKFIVWDEQPFSLAENYKFEKFIHKSLQPKYKKISRQTMRRDAIKIFSEYKTNLLQVLITLTSCLSLTSDIWTSNHSDQSYMCITAHWIDSDFFIQKRIISFKIFEFPHTANAIVRQFHSILHSYNISNKIFSISFDNASNNDSAIDKLKILLHPIFNGAFFHIRCACHILNLCVQDGIREVDEHVTKLRNAVRFVTSSTSRNQDFRQTCKSYGLSYKKFKLDIKTRWNSTYDMLTTCFPFKDPLTLFYNERMPDGNIEENDWDKAKLLHNILEIFYNASTHLSGVYYPTSCLILEHLVLISEIFSQYRHDENVFQVIFKMETKFKKYWKNISPLYCLASIMDPRLKLEGVHILLDEYYKNMELEGVDEKKNEVSTLLDEMYNVYNLKFGNTMNPTSSQTNVSTSSKNITGRIRSILNRKGTSTSRSSNFNELTFFLENNHTSLLTEEQIDNFDILSWWRSQGKSYPVISAMARDLLTPPVSTVASESCFSAGGRVLDEKRSRMNEESVEMCICLKDWLDAEDRLQDKGGHSTSSDDDEQSLGSASGSNNG